MLLCQPRRQQTVMKMKIITASEPDYALMNHTRDVADRICHVSTSAPTFHSSNTCTSCKIRTAIISIYKKLCSYGGIKNHT